MNHLMFIIVNVINQKVQYNGRKMAQKQLPIPVQSAIKKLGHDIRDARRRRRIQTSVMAERAMISRGTLNKIEQGDAGVSIANYGVILFILGMLDRLRSIADIQYDSVGQSLDEERLPQRIRHSKIKDGDF